MRDAAQVHNNGLDSVTLALDLGLNLFHLVAIERVGVVAANVNSSHVCGWKLSTKKLECKESEQAISRRIEHEPVQSGDFDARMKWQEKA